MGRRNEQVAVVRELHFSAGHRVVGHEGHCRHPHGHNYEVWVHARSIAGLDNIGRVIDFGVIKSVIGSWIDQYWDHAFIFWKEDKAMRQSLDLFDDLETGGNRTTKKYSLPYNPTAENLAKYLAEQVAPHILACSGVRDIEVFCVEIFETPRCKVTYTIGDVE